MFKMRPFVRLSIFFLVPYLLCFLLAGAEDVCVKKTGCSCEFANGTGFDLSPSAKTTFYTAQIYESKSNGTEIKLSTYYYHPCYDICTNASCTSYLSINRYVIVMKQVDPKLNTFQMESGIYEFMGTSNVTNFTGDGKSIIYANGPSSTKVLLVCTESTSQLQIYSLEEPNDVILAFYSPDACLKQIEEIGGRSFGSSLLIVFFTLVIFYLVLGVLTRKLLMGATGLEVIPNLPFWIELPNLVKDGWVFVISGFKVPAQSPGLSPGNDPNSYDSI